MQARRGRCHRSRLACEDSLVAFAIGGLVGSADIRGQRDMSNALDCSDRVGATTEPQLAKAIRATFDDLRF